MRICALFSFLSFTALACSTPLFSQNAPPQSDPQALTLAARSVAVMTGGAAINDVTLSGNVTQSAGSQTDTGTITLLAKGATESRVDLALSHGNRSDILNGSSGFPQGVWIGTDGVSNGYAPHNCWTDPSWFFPALSSLSTAGSNQNIVWSYVGAETLNGTSVQHLRSYAYEDGQRFFQQISATDFYLDSNSLLPLVTKFNIHPDNDGSTNIPVEINFSNYQAANGIAVPYHVQRLVRGSVFLDVTIASVVLNSGLPDSDFSIQ